MLVEIIPWILDSSDRGPLSLSLATSKPTFFKLKLMATKNIFILQELMVSVVEHTFIQKTHYQIAQELNSSREVITRLLKKLEQRGMVRVNRNQIELLN